MAKKIKKVVPVSVRCETFEDVLGDIMNKANAEQAKYKAMTPKQRKVYIAKKEKEEQEIQEILKELGPNGPTRIQIGF